jgi:hypothetical protein
MADLAARLHEFWHNPHTRRLARSAPLALLAGCAGATLGTLVALPGFAATGLGIVLGGLSINLTSDLISKLTDPALDDLERDMLLEDALKQGDPDAQGLTAALLLNQGPTVAQALTEATRQELTDQLAEGMQQAGGPLAAIAPRYAAALRDPATDWERLRKDLYQTVSTSTQTRKATNIRGGKQLSEDYDHSIQTAEATQDMEGFDQIAKRNPARQKPN